PLHSNARAIAAPVITRLLTRLSTRLLPAREIDHVLVAMAPPGLHTFLPRLTQSGAVLDEVRPVLPHPFVNESSAGALELLADERPYGCQGGEVGIGDGGQTSHVIRNAAVLPLRAEQHPVHGTFEQRPPLGTAQEIAVKPRNV